MSLLDYPPVFDVALLGIAILAAPFVMRLIDRWLPADTEAELEERFARAIGVRPPDRAYADDRRGRLVIVTAHDVELPVPAAPDGYCRCGAHVYGLPCHEGFEQPWTLRDVMTAVREMEEL